jgi:hypothetical protein
MKHCVLMNLSGVLEIARRDVGLRHLVGHGEPDEKEPATDGLREVKSEIFSGHLEGPFCKW